MDNLGVAASAIAASDRLAATDVAAVLASFGTTLEALERSEPDTPGCSSPNATASVVDKVDPLYSDEARVKRETGTVKIVVSLTRDGLAEWVILYATTTPPESTLVSESMIATDASTYHAGRVGCVAKPGRYIFMSTFGVSRS